ncbi:hypothetical protein IB276_17965 [Ensifer sp. ENS04]|uniref:hypothetical protein n=1 Tax=Ensifer sp. ENS04 TaxID=2769281 RepID=UPI00177C2EB2|nr:hypothetical protein [Ensifer sp. ENS04]MBD9541343.1 hypothetical protein [Ensifer sp. ENS04]
MDYQILFERLERSRISKYDLLLKSLFLPHRSQLRRLLGLPAGESHSIELDDWKTRTADSVIFSQNAPCHVEFQTELQSKMPWRMLEYFWRIQERLSNEFTKPVHLNQMLVYVGRETDDNRMKPPLKSGGLTFSYAYRDLKKVGKEADERSLYESDAPYDWILRVLCFETVDVSVWKNVATKIRDLLHGRVSGSKLVAAYFVVAVLLRQPTDKEVILDMLQIKLDELPLIRNAIDKAEDVAARRTLVRAVLRQLEKRGVEPSDIPSVELLLDVDESRLEDLLDAVIEAHSPQDAMSLVRASLRQNGLLFD